MDSSDRFERSATTTRRRVLKAAGAGVGHRAGNHRQYRPAAGLLDGRRTADTPVRRERTPSPRTRRVDRRHHGRENIAFVSHEGDVVARRRRRRGVAVRVRPVVARRGGPLRHRDGQSRLATLWDRFLVAKYREYFGPSRYEGRDWFGGAGPSNGDEGRDNLNTYQLFSAGGYDFLHLARKSHRNRRRPIDPTGWGRASSTSIRTGRRYSQRTRISATNHSDGPGSCRKRAKSEIRVRPSSSTPQSTSRNGGTTRSQRECPRGPAGSTTTPALVYELLANYQFRPNGGNGFMRRIEFRPGDGADAPTGSGSDVLAETGAETTDSDSQFGFDLDFDARFGSSSKTPEPRRRRKRQTDRRPRSSGDGRLHRDN